MQRCPHCQEPMTDSDEKIRWGTIIFHPLCFDAMKVRAKERNEDVTLIWRGNKSEIVFRPIPQVFC